MSKQGIVETTIPCNDNDHAQIDWYTIDYSGMVW